MAKPRKAKKPAIGENWNPTLDRGIVITPPARGGLYLWPMTTGNEFAAAAAASTSAERKYTRKQQMGLINLEAHGRRTARRS